MKKFLFILIIFVAFLNLIGLHSYAREKYNISLKKNESYLILLNKGTIDLISNNKNALYFEILTTLYNEKNQILLKALKEGTYRLYITLENEDFIILEINSGNKGENFDIYNSQYIKTILKLDTIEKKREENKFDFVLDEPPLLKKQEKKEVKP